jgi:hypothetical protein
VLVPLSPQGRLLSVFAILSAAAATAVVTLIVLLLMYPGLRIAEAGAWAAGVLFGSNIVAFTILCRIRTAVMPWTNGDLILFHGTDTQSLAAFGPSFHVGHRLGGFTVNLAICRPATDFGQGFYTTTSLHQAREWANARVRRLPAHPVQPKGIVLQFDVDRNWLATQESLVFVRAIPDYWDFVAHCRAGLPVHARHPPHRPGAQAEYDVVYGLVTIWPSRLLIPRL